MVLPEPTSLGEVAPWVGLIVIGGDLARARDWSSVSA